jgi:hypothetical protein
MAGQDVAYRGADLVSPLPFNYASVRPGPQGAVGISWFSAFRNGQDFDMTTG